MKINTRFNPTEACTLIAHEAVSMRDAHIDELILRTTIGDLAAYLQDTGAHVLPLSSAAAQCKEAKPVAVVLPGGGKVETAMWNNAAAAILKDCDADPSATRGSWNCADRSPAMPASS